MWQCHLVGLLVCMFLNQLLSKLRVLVLSFTLHAQPDLGIKVSSKQKQTSTQTYWRIYILIRNTEWIHLHQQNCWDDTGCTGDYLLRFATIHTAVKPRAVSNSGSPPAALKEPGCVWFRLLFHWFLIVATVTFLIHVVFLKSLNYILATVYTHVCTLLRGFKSLFLYLALVVNSASVSWLMRLSVI